MKRNILVAIVILGVCWLVGCTTYKIDGMIKQGKENHYNMKELVEENVKLSKELDKMKKLEKNEETEKNEEPKVSTEYLEELGFNSQENDF